MKLAWFRHGATKAMLHAASLAISLSALSPQPSFAQKLHAEEPSHQRRVPNTAKRPDESETAYQKRVQEQRQLRDWENQNGAHHFDRFDDFVERTRARKAQPKPLFSLERARLADVYISTGTGSVNGTVLVRITRLDDAGAPDTKFGYFKPDTQAAEAYAHMFGAEASPTARAQLSSEFLSLAVVLDDSAFFLRTSTSTGSPSVRVTPVLAFPPSHAGRIYLRNSGVDPFGTGEVVRAFPRASGRIQTIYARIGEPAVYATPPPGRDIERFGKLAGKPFKSSDLSAVLLEGNTDARRALEEGRKSGALSIAADFGGQSLSDAALKSRLDSEFQLRSRKGKAIAVIGHYEMATDRLFVRQGTRNIASISREEVLRMSEAYDVEVILLGCQTASSATRDSTPFASLLTNVNSEAVITALVKSAARSGNWRDLLGNISSEDTPLVFSASLDRFRSSRNDERRAELHQGRLADGRSYLMAVLFYRVKCAVVREC